MVARRMRQAMPLVALALACVAMGCSGSEPAEPVVIDVGAKERTWAVSRDGDLRRVRRLDGTGLLAWSPGGRRIAVEVEAPRISFQLAVSTSHGRILHRLHTTGYSFEDVAWSPDGRRVAYEVTDGDGNGVVSPDPVATESASGGDRRVLTRYGIGHGWSPGGRLGFVAIRGRDGRLVTSSATGGDRRTLVHHAVEMLDWSADGGTIVYRHGTPPSRYDEPGGQDLWAVNADGSSPWRVAAGVREYVGISPDGRWILYSRLRKDRTVALWIARVDGTGQRLVADHLLGTPTQEGPGYTELPQCGWAPGGRGVYLLHARVAGEKAWDRRLHLFTVDGRARDLGEIGTGPMAWSPDGRKIAWFDDAKQQIGLVNGDGSERRVVGRFATRASVWGMTWSSDGRELVFVGVKYRPD